MSETTTACPECDSSQVYERETVSPPWRCNDCGAEFETPIEREPRDPLTPGRSDLDDAKDGPTAADLDTPDTLFTDIMVGEKFAVTETAEGGDYTDLFTVVDVVKRTVWDVPFGDDWTDATLVLSYGGATKPTHEAHVAADGNVELFATISSRGPNHVADVTGVDHAGEVSTHSKVRLLGDDGVEKPEGDDSWQQYYQERST